MKTKIEIKSICEEILFEFEKENNSIKDTLIEAINKKADLRGADLWGAYLQEADLEKIYAQNTILPEGELVVWKKLKNNLIAKLRISAKVKRVHAIGSRKCRFEFAKVINIYDGKKQVMEGHGKYNNLHYKKGETVKPDKFDDSPLIECSNGIHAFITRQEAEEYNY